jgi:carboxypeptidase C (cathepsin A)
MADAHAQPLQVLIYVGTYDWICNWIGNERWTLNLEWSGKPEFAASELRVWEVEPGVRAGRTRGERMSVKKGEGRKGGLVYATVEGAGHMVSLFCYSRLLVGW